MILLDDNFASIVAGVEEGQYPRLAISLSQPYERPKRGHDLREIHSSS